MLLTEKKNVADIKMLTLLNRKKFSALEEIEITDHQVDQSRIK